MGELRVAPAVTAMAALLEPHRPWLESVLGCPLADALTFELEVPFGHLAVEALLEGVQLDHGCLDEAAALRPAVARWAVPPGVSPRIALEPSRNRQVPMLERPLAWAAHWKDTPVAVWFEGLTHALAAIDVPFVSFAASLRAEWQHCLLVNRAEVAPALNLLRSRVFQPRNVVRVLGGRDIPLPAHGYDWAQVVLHPDLTSLVREDFESFLRREGWFKRQGLPFQRSYLFYGPPGNGKTSVIRVMASHPAMSAFALDFSNEQLENGALSDLFEAAGCNAPALVLFEDLDRLFGKNAQGDNRTRITFQHLLNCLDGLGHHDGVIVVATANDPTELDSAVLRRPGRFDRAVPFRPPSGELRREYLRRLSHRTLDPETLALAGVQTEGFSFAQVREAYIVGGQFAFQRGRDAIDRDDLLEGIRRVRGEGHAVGERADGRVVGFGHATPVGAP
jgi:hypothetical protein